MYNANAMTAAFSRGKNFATSPRPMSSVTWLPAGNDATVRAIPWASRPKQNGMEMLLRE